MNVFDRLGVDGEDRGLLDDGGANCTLFSSASGAHGGLCGKGNACSGHEAGDSHSREHPFNLILFHCSSFSLGFPAKTEFS